MKYEMIFIFEYQIRQNLFEYQIFVTLVENDVGRHGAAWAGA